MYLCSLSVGYVAVLFVGERGRLAMLIVSAIGALVCGIPMSRRVLAAWTTYATFRWRWRHKRPSLRRWLWIKTLRLANGVEDRR